MSGSRALVVVRGGLLVAGDVEVRLLASLTMLASIGGDLEVSFSTGIFGASIYVHAHAIRPTAPSRHCWSSSPSLVHRLKSSSHLLVPDPVSAVVRGGSLWVRGASRSEPSRVAGGRSLPHRWRYYPSRPWRQASIGDGPRGLPLGSGFLVHPPSHAVFVRPCIPSQLCVSAPVYPSQLCTSAPVIVFTALPSAHLLPSSQLCMSAPVNPSQLCVFAPVYLAAVSSVRSCSFWRSPRSEPFVLGSLLGRSCPSFAVFSVKLSVYCSLLGGDCPCR
ncbi:hypothetical protein K523DRAFT_130889 [Schizophyllum commune Tattone D]|nr:hypothetical protein K523DRAFT_130889 [Schizophyllum commune Tattone D]